MIYISFLFQNSWHWF